MPGLPVGAGSQFADVHVLPLLWCAHKRLPAKLPADCRAIKRAGFQRSPPTSAVTALGLRLAGGVNGICRSLSGRIHKRLYHVKNKIQCALYYFLTIDLGMNYDEAMKGKEKYGTVFFGGCDYGKRKYDSMDYCCGYSCSVQYRLIDRPLVGSEIAATGFIT